MLSPEELSRHIEGCAQNERESQKKIYNSFYGYAMSICVCHCSKEEDAREILNDGFLKIFKRINEFKPAYSNEVSSFKGWLRKIMVYTAIDHYRKNNKQSLVTELNTNYVIEAEQENAVDKISYDEIIRFIQKLSPAYRIVLNLFIMEGFSHEEISKKLGISVGASKSNLSKARMQLQKILYQENKTIPLYNVG